MLQHLRFFPYCLLYSPFSVGPTVKKEETSVALDWSYYIHLQISAFAYWRADSSKRMVVAVTAGTVAVAVMIRELRVSPPCLMPLSDSPKTKDAICRVFVQERRWKTVFLEYSPLPRQRKQMLYVVFARMRGAVPSLRKGHLHFSSSFFRHRYSYRYFQL